MTLQTFPECSPTSYLLNQLKETTGSFEEPTLFIFTEVLLLCFKLLNIQ